MHQKSRLYPLAGAALPLGLLALLPGCGGGGSNGGSRSVSSSGGNTGGGSQTANYAEAVTLADGQAGALTLSTIGGSATGTLAVAAASPAVRSRAAGPRVGGTIPVGVYAVTGTFANGTFTLTGAISGTAFALTVTPPSGSAAGNFSLVTGGTTYAGTITTAPTGTSTNSSIAGTYLLVSITNPNTSQTVTCPGSLAFGSSDSDTCGTSEVTTLNANGTYTITIGGTTASTGSYTLVGTILTTTGKELEASGNGQTVTAVSAVATSGNTLTTTLLSSTASDQQAQAQAGEVFTYSKTSGGGTSGGAGSGGGTGGATINLAGTTWQVTSVSSGSASSTCPGSAQSDPSSPSSDVVISCGSDDRTTFNANGTQTTVAVGGDNAIHTITGTWSQNGNTVTRTDVSETPPDATNSLPYTISGPITVVNSSDFKVNTSLNGTPISLTFTKQ